LKNSKEGERMKNVISLIEEAKRRLYRKVQEGFVREDKFV